MDHLNFADCTDIAFRNIDEVGGEDSRLLKVRGLIFHSSIIADHIELHHEHDRVHILVAMALTRKNKSGLFDLYIPIPDRVKRVTFGLSEKTIWQRTSDATAETPVDVIAEHVA